MAYIHLYSCSKVVYHVYLTDVHIYLLLSSSRSAYSSHDGAHGAQNTCTWNSSGTVILGLMYQAKSNLSFPSMAVSSCEMSLEICRWRGEGEGGMRVKRELD